MYLCGMDEAATFADLVDLADPADPQRIGRHCELLYEPGCINERVVQSMVAGRFVLWRVFLPDPNRDCRLVHVAVGTPQQELEPDHVRAGLCCRHLPGEVDRRQCAVGVGAAVLLRLVSRRRQISPTHLQSPRGTGRLAASGLDRGAYDQRFAVSTVHADSQFRCSDRDWFVRGAHRTGNVCGTSGDVFSAFAAHHGDGGPQSGGFDVRGAAYLRGDEPVLHGGDHRMGCESDAQVRCCSLRWIKAGMVLRRWF